MPLVSLKASVKAWWEWSLAPQEESLTWRAARFRASRGRRSFLSIILPTFLEFISLTEAGFDIYCLNYFSFGIVKCVEDMITVLLTNTTGHL